MLAESDKYMYSDKNINVRLMFRDEDNLNKMIYSEADKLKYIDHERYKNDVDMIYEKFLNFLKTGDKTYDVEGKKVVFHSMSTLMVCDSFSSLYFCDIDNDIRLVIKLNKGDSDLKYIVNELNICLDLSPHPNIIPPISHMFIKEKDYEGERSIFKNPTKINTIKNHILLFFPYIKGDNLFDIVQRMGDNHTKFFDVEKEYKGIFHSLLLTVKHCHSLRITHKDIKLDNVMYDRDACSIKLIDFGFSHSLGDDKVIRSKEGSVDYMSPDIIKDIPYDPYRADLYAIGVLIYAVVYKRYPFSTSCTFSSVVQRLIKKNQITFDDYKFIPNRLRAIVYKMLDFSTDVNKNLTIKDILDDEYWKEE
jgi:serine/threonine protein kinase